MPLYRVYGSWFLRISGWTETLADSPEEAIILAEAEEDGPLPRLDTESIPGYVTDSRRILEALEVDPEAAGEIPGGDEGPAESEELPDILRRMSRARRDFWRPNRREWVQVNDPLPSTPDDPPEFEEDVVDS